MKKFSVMMMALAMVMGMTQCKKDNPTSNNNIPVLEGETYNITLVLSNGSSSNSKVDVNLNFDNSDEAPVRYEIDDTIYVAYDGRHAGKLVCTSLSTSTDQNDDKLGVFTGNITVPYNNGDNKPLYFYFLGNKYPEFSNPGGFTTGYVVDLSDQSSELPVISYAPSLENFNPDLTTYSVKYNWLANQCALVKFTMENIYDNDPMTAMSTANDLDQNSNAIYTTTKPITIKGMKNQVTINLANAVAEPWTYVNGVPHTTTTLNEDFIKWDVNGDGAIQLYSPSATEEVVRYAIVAPGSYNTPQGDLDVEFNAATDPYGFFGTYRIAGDDGAVTIANNAYYKDAKIDLVWHSGAFTVSNDEVSTYQVVFSRGNAQYQRSTNKWRLAKHQYDYIGGGLLLTNTSYLGTVVYDIDDESSPALNHNNGANMSDNEKKLVSDYGGWIDLYGWGTGNRPTVATNYSTGGEYSHHNYVDWGANAFVNSGKPTDNSWWTTLSNNEWAWLIESRGGETNATNKNGLGTVNGVKGLILLPDNWAGMPSGIGVTWVPSKDQSWTGVNWATMTFDESKWQKMEKAGAVFLPAAGYLGHTLSTGNNNIEFDGGGGSGGSNQDHGAYWSNTVCDENVSSYYMRFGNASYYSSSPSKWVRSKQYMDPANGNAVRLVHKL